MNQGNPNRDIKKTTHGRGTEENPPNRFEKIFFEYDKEWNTQEDPSPKTEFFIDTSRSLITYNDSPDLGFHAGINPYRGCEHGCVYCFARPNHEYLGLSSGLDFETKIFVKKDAPEILRKELSSRSWKPQVITLSGVTDPYQPVERRLQLTRRCLEVLAEFRNPVVIITKNRLIMRDVDILKELAQYKAVAVFISVTTLDHTLCNLMEPRTSRPKDRIETIKMLSQEGIPVGVLVAPIIPALTDHEVISIVEKCACAGARFAGYVVLRLPFSVKEIFENWLEIYFPQKKAKILHRIRSIRRGKLNDPRFKMRLTGEGIFAQQIKDMFSLACKRAGIHGRGPSLSTASFRKPNEAQLILF